MVEKIEINVNIRRKSRRLPRERVIHPVQSHVWMFLKWKEKWKLTRQINQDYDGISSCLWSISAIWKAIRFDFLSRTGRVCFHLLIHRLSLFLPAAAAATFARGKSSPAPKKNFIFKTEYKLLLYSDITLFSPSSSRIVGNVERHREQEKESHREFNLLIVPALDFISTSPLERALTECDKKKYTT